MKILVTGASRGIGKAIALKFLSLGYEVIGMDKAPSSIEENNYTHIVHDIRDKDFPVIEGTSILINSAGTFTYDEEDIEVNLLGVMAVCEFYAESPSVKSVLNIASSSARNGAEFAYYAASKGGLVTYTKNLALRLGKRGAIANTLSPGGVLTESNAHVLDDESKRKEAIGESLLSKWATVEEIAEWAYFLTAVNRSMTGEDILVDNGEMLKSNFVW